MHVELLEGGTQTCILNLQQDETASLDITKLQNVFAMLTSFMSLIIIQKALQIASNTGKNANTIRIAHNVLQSLPSKKGAPGGAAAVAAGRSCQYLGEPQSKMVSRGKDN